MCTTFCSLTFLFSPQDVWSTLYAGRSLTAERAENVMNRPGLDLQGGGEPAHMQNDINRCECCGAWTSNLILRKSLLVGFLGLHCTFITSLQPFGFFQTCSILVQTCPLAGSAPIGKARLRGKAALPFTVWAPSRVLSHDRDPLIMSWVWERFTNAQFCMTMPIIFIIRFHG